MHSMGNMIFDLEKRTLDFSISIIQLCKKIRRTEDNKNSINQLIRSATSVGANYREANGAASRKDFRNKIVVCRKEAKESLYWLELLHNTEDVNLEENIQEASHLANILSKIIKTTDEKTITNNM